MDTLAKTIFERAYQSYLCGSDNYSYKFSSKSPSMISKYNKAIKYLLDNELIIVNFRSDDKVKMTITEKGIDYGNLSL